jgi:hypothetical protein
MVLSRSLRAIRFRGAAALMEMLDSIGGEDVVDHDIVHIMVSHELEMREILYFALTKLVDEENDD